MYKIKINPLTGKPFEGRCQLNNCKYHIIDLATATQEEINFLGEIGHDFIEKVEATKPAKEVK